jgi:hypothetical protein
MLERWSKNQYFGEGYFLSCAKTAQISRLTGMAGQSAFETATPFSPENEGAFWSTIHLGTRPSLSFKQIVSSEL